MYSYVLDTLFYNCIFSVLEGSFYKMGIQFPPYCFPLPTVLLYIVFFMMMIVIISWSIFCTVVKCIIQLI